MTILVLQPIRPTNPPALREKANCLLERMFFRCDALRFDVHQDDSAIPVPDHKSVYMRHATVRNYMLDRYLKPEHEYVLWIDSDLIDYPADLPHTLMEYGERAIVAPFAMLDKWPHRFYDIGGFIEKGSRARMWPPYFNQDGAAITLDSVGCCYLAPAQLYHEGVRYSPPPTDYYVEHWSVMREARQRGYKVMALRDVRVTHAWLPDYGLDAN